MASVSFNFRPSSKRGGGQAGSVYLRVIHRRKSLSITTPYHIFPEEWDAQKRTLALPLSGDSPRMKYLLDTEDKMNRDLRRVESVMATLERGGEYTVEQVVRGVRLNAKDNTLSAYVRKLAFDLTDRGQERTARAYKTAANGLIRFNKGRDLRLEQINATLARNYERWMKDRGKSLNTISFYMRNLRAIYNRAIKEQRIQARFENPFSNVYTGVCVTRKRALTKDELMLLDGLDTTLSGGMPDPAAEPLDEGLQTSLAYFLFCFHARGMSFVDMAYLKKDNVRNGVITYFRKKTGQLLQIKVTPSLRSLMDFFAAQTSASEFLFPVIADPRKNSRLQYETGLRTHNARLKRLARMAGINKPVSSHVSRHSWATLAHNVQIPLAVISEGLGHSNEKTTYTYLASLERSVVDSASEIIAHEIKRAI